MSCVPVCRTSCPFSLVWSVGLTHRTWCQLSLMGAAVTHAHTHAHGKSKTEGQQSLTENSNGTPLKQSWLYRGWSNKNCWIILRQLKKNRAPCTLPCLLLLLTPCLLCACSYYENTGTILSNQNQVRTKIMQINHERGCLKINLEQKALKYWINWCWTLK